MLLDYVWRRVFLPPMHLWKKQEHQMTFSNSKTWKDLISAPTAFYHLYPVLPWPRSLLSDLVMFPASLLMEPKVGQFYPAAQFEVLRQGWEQDRVCFGVTMRREERVEMVKVCQGVRKQPSAQLWSSPRGFGRLWNVADVSLVCAGDSKGLGHAAVSRNVW